MARVSQSVKNLIAGVSQQPAKLRHMEQLEEQINAFSTTADGLQKRPPTLHLATLTDSMSVDSSTKVHFINRDSSEKYIVFLKGDGTCKVWDILNNEWKPVEVRKWGDGNPAFGENDAVEYLKAADPQSTYRLITVADYTFILNRKKVPRMNDIHFRPPFPKGAIVQVKQGQYGRRYVINIGGKNVALHTTPDGSKPEHSTQIDTQLIADKLREMVNSSSDLGNGATIITKPNCFLIKGVNSGNVNATLSNGVIEVRGINMANVGKYNNHGMSFWTSKQVPIKWPHKVLKTVTAPSGFNVDVNQEITSIRVHKGNGWVAVGFDNNYQMTHKVGYTKPKKKVRDRK